MSWTTKHNHYTHGAFYVLDETGREIAFCQTGEDAERIAQIEQEIVRTLLNL